MERDSFLFLRPLKREEKKGERCRRAQNGTGAIPLRASLERGRRTPTTRTERNGHHSSSCDRWRRKKNDDDANRMERASFLFVRPLEEKGER